MKINNNIPALNANRILGDNHSKLQKSLERLSSGKQINRAADDAAGLAISKKMQAQIKGLRQASRNSLDGISLIQTGEGALEEVHSMLQRMRELSVQGANEIYEDGDLDAICQEIKSLSEEVKKIGETTDFNGIKLLNGNLLRQPEKIEDSFLLTGFNPGGKYTIIQSNGAPSHKQADEDGNILVNENLGESEFLVLKDHLPVDQEEKYKDMFEKAKRGDLDLQIGSNEGEKIVLNLGNYEIDIEKLGKEGEDDLAITDILLKIGDFIDSENQEVVENPFGEAISVFNRAVEQVSKKRASFGAIQNRLESTVSNLDNTAENLTAAMARIEDLDMALEMAEFTKYDILQQSGVSMLSEANRMPQSMLQLIQG